MAHSSEGKCPKCQHRYIADPMTIYQQIHLSCIRIDIHQEDDCILSRGRKISHQINMDRRHMSRKLWYLARANRQSCQKILPRKWRNENRAYEESSPRPLLNQTKGSKPSTVPQKKQHEMFVKVVDLKETVYSDQTGKCTYLPIKGMRYIIIAYHTDEN